MIGITGNCCALETLPYGNCSYKKSPLQYHYPKEYPKSPKRWNPCFWILNSYNSTICNLYCSKNEQDWYCKTCHWFCFSMTIGMIRISRFLSMPHSKIYYCWSNNICSTLNRIGNQCIRIPKNTSEKFYYCKRYVSSNSKKSNIFTIFWSIRCRYSIHRDILEEKVRKTKYY